MTVDIVIPQFNNAEYTMSLLSSIKRFTKDYRIVLVDNGSDPEEFGLIEWYLKDMPHTIIRNDENLGFVKATNQGIQASTADFVVLQNNDTIVGPDWLKKMLAVFKKYPKAGIVGPTTIWAESWQNRDRITAKLQKPVPQGEAKVNAMLAFFCAVIKREVIEEVGLLSEEFGIGFGDDDDYCERVRAAGFELYLCLDVTVPHYHRTTFKTAIPNWRELQVENMNLYAQKWGKRP